MSALLWIFSSVHPIYLSSQGGDCGITGKNDADDFRRLISAMEILRFTPEDQSATFRVLSSILHLGNVYFQRHEVVFAKQPLCILFSLFLLTPPLTLYFRSDISF